MIGTLLLVGITLSLDNFRTALALGALRLTRRRALHVALVFGFWDGVAPLVGILMGVTSPRQLAKQASLWAPSC